MNAKVWQLLKRQESETFIEKANHELGWSEWAASVDGASWSDGTRTPMRNQAITADDRLKGGQVLTMPSRRPGKLKLTVEEWNANMRVSEVLERISKWKRASAYAMRSCEI
jgi:hypothetical protein